MHTLRNRQHTGEFASVMLCLWLFATAISGGNACVLPVDRTVDHHGSGTIVAPQDVSPHGASVAVEGREPDAGLKACASFCEAEQNVVTKAQSARGNDSAHLSRSLVNLAGWWPAFRSGVAQVPWHSQKDPPRVVVPLTIAFLRLTI